MTRRILKSLKIAIVSSVLLAVLSAVAASLVFYFYPEESLLNIIKTSSEKTLKRRVEISSLKYSIRGVVLKDVVVYDSLPDGSDAGLVYAQEAVIRFSLVSLLRKDVKIDSIKLINLKLVWEFRKDGTSNISRLLSDISEGHKSPEQNRKVKISKIGFEGFTLWVSNTPESYRPLCGEYFIEGTVKIIDNGKLLVSGAKIVLPEKRGEILPELEVETKNGFRITGKAKLVNSGMAWLYTFSSKKLQLPFMVVNGEVDSLEITKTMVKGHAKVVSTLKSSPKRLEADGWCTVDIPALMVYLSGIKAGIEKSSATLNSMDIYSRAGGGVTKFSFSEISMDITDARSMSPVALPGLYGRLKGNISYDGRSFSGHIEVSDAGYGISTRMISGVNTVLDISSGSFKKENIPFRFFDNNCTVSVASTDSTFKNFYMIVRCEKISTDSIKLGKPGDAGIEGDEQKILRSGLLNLPFSVSGKVQVNELVHDNFTFKNVDSDFRASGDSIKILGFSSYIFSGRLTGAGKISINNGIPDAQVQLKYSGIKVQDIGFKNENMKNRFFGFAEGSASLTFLVKENLLSTIKGNTTFTITKGKIVNTGVQNGLIIFLAELRYKLKDLEFNKIYGNIDINKDQFNVNSFIFNAEDVRLMLNGVIDSDFIAKNMLMKLEFNNHFIKDIPRPAVTVFGEYSNGNWYIIPFEINGNITESKNIKMLKKNR